MGQRLGTTCIKARAWTGFLWTTRPIQGQGASMQTSMVSMATTRCVQIAHGSTLAMTKVLVGVKRSFPERLTAV
jgi:hypothetical protein